MIQDPKNLTSSVPEYGLWTSDVLEKSFWDDDNASYNGEVESWAFTRSQRDNKPTPVPKVDRTQNSRQTDQVWPLPLFSAVLLVKVHEMPGEQINNF